MSKRARLQQRQAIAAAAAARPAMVQSGPDLLAGNVQLIGSSGYQAAWNTHQRGYLWWPTTDPQREVDSYSRQEIARRVHWCCANLGLARRLAGALVNLIAGTGLAVKSTNKDTAFRARAERYYNARANSPITYDVRQRITGRKAQRLAVRTMVTDGGMVKVRARDARGGALRAFYSAIAVSGAPKSSPDGWIDGCKLDSAERITHYRFPQRNGTERIVPAAFVSYYTNLEQFGQVHGASVFAHAVAPMIDITELDATVMAGLKEAHRIAYYIAPALGAQTGVGLEDRFRQGGKTNVTDATGASISLKDVQTPGAEIPRLPPGWDIKRLLDERPHENTREFSWSFIQKVSWGAEMSPELLWNVTKLGGANTRYVLADAQTMCAARQQDLVDHHLADDYISTIGAGLDCGDLEGPDESIDPEWWAHGWIPPERQTLDFGRDGKLHIEQYQAGLITATRLFAMRGQDVFEEVNQHLEFIAWRKKRMAELGLSMAEAYPAAPGAAGYQPAWYAPEKAGPKDPNADGQDDPEEEL
ncbi:MAG: phage portal protein [Verrucomicrobia bacterium]|nr:phage portal protein [Verrucomicrobiota bacterium]